jgi:hypothetical protein
MLQQSSDLIFFFSILFSRYSKFMMNINHISFVDVHKEYESLLYNRIQTITSPKT